jgi:hypothetical protein
MSDDEMETNGDESFKDYLKNMSDNFALPEFLVSVNNRRSTKALNLFRAVMSSYSQLPKDDPMKTKLLELTDKISDACLASLRFYDYIMIQETDGDDDV